MLGHKIKQALRKPAVWASYIFTLPYRLFRPNKIKFGKNFICHPFIKFVGPGKVIFGDNVNAWQIEDRNRFYTYSTDAVIEIKSNTRLNGIWCHCKENITIGKDCVVASCTLMDHNFHETNPIKRKRNISDKAKPILVERNVWLAGQSTILKGVTIGKNSTIGFRAVVAKDIPPNSVAVGNPARVVTSLN